MLQILADRFLQLGGAWIDLASGAPVRMRLSVAGTTSEQLAWNGRCSTLANLRHPLLVPLLDFGVAGAGRTFEAYGTGAPVHASGTLAARLLRHAARFLEAHHVDLTSALAGFVLRPVVAGRSAPNRPLGLALQRRAVFEAVWEALDVAQPGGACGIDIRGTTHSGLRTLRLLAARAARLQGYVPVAPAVARAHNELLDRLGDRHVCVIVDGDDPGASAASALLLARLNAAGARRHVVLTFARVGSADLQVGPPGAGLKPSTTDRPANRNCSADLQVGPSHLQVGPPGAGLKASPTRICSADLQVGSPPAGLKASTNRWIPVDTMGVAAMTAMVFVDPEDGPSTGELFAAAREAEGRPGLFVAGLGADNFEPRHSLGGRSVTVHETSADYVVTPPDGGERFAGSPPIGRTAGVALRSASRAEALARHGRHAAASRVLSRAVRLLRARAERPAAAACAELRGWHALDRADVDRAVRAFEEARDLCPEGTTGISAATGIGVAWIEDGRFAEAEAALRTAILAARTLRTPALTARAVAALGRCLHWQGRCDEAAAALSETFDGAPAESDRARIAAVTARVHLAEGAIPSSMRAARQAIQLATAAADPRALISARRAMAATLLVVGDLPGGLEQVRSGLRTARQAHLPLAALRLRVTMLDLLAGTDSEAAAPRLRGRAVTGEQFPGSAGLQAGGRDVAGEQMPGSAGLQAGLDRLSARLLANSARVPRLLRFQIRAACARAAQVDFDPELQAFIRTTGAVALARDQVARPASPVAELEGFLELGHTASDDRTALDRMGEELQKRLRAGTVLVAAAGEDRRIVALCGRAWPGDPQIAWRAAAAGLGISPDCAVEPAQGAEALRYGGVVIGAVACRWVAGTTVDADRAMALLRVAALAMAPHVQALLDRVEPQSASVTWKDLLGDSPPACALRDSIARAARAPFPVLIEGESGSGKELVARAIHRLGARRDRRFCAINCAALSDDLLEAELFGHTRGAFTGAVGDRAGLFEDADGGTLFLDEIGELSSRAQAKLLRVLQDGEVRRVGENVSRRVDVRIVAATNRRLEQEAAAGRFRTDLRFRLDVVRIEVPPLRDRTSDVPMLASHFWTDAATRVGSRATLSPDALAALARYDWPGNVRELQNVIAWTAVHSPRRGRIGPAGLPAHLAQAATPAGTTFEAAREEFERRFVRAALASANGHRMRAAESMGVSRQGLAKMLRRLGIEDL